MTSTAVLPRRTNRHGRLVRRVAIGTVLAAAAGSLLAAVGTVTSAAATPLVVKAAADAYVQSDVPDTNYGAATQLTVRAAGDKAAAVTYLRFTVSGLTRPPAAVQLQLYSYAQSATGVQVWTSTSNWTETGLTWNTAPPLGSTLVANMPKLVLNSYASADVSSVVTGNGTYTFAMNTTSTLGKQFASREVTADPPQLVISTAAPDTVTATSGSGQTAAVGTAYAAPLVATVTDGTGAAVSGVPVTFTAPTSGAAATFAGGAAAVSVTTDLAGVATSPPLTANVTPGTFTVSAISDGAAAPATFSLTNGTAASPSPSVPPSLTPSPTPSGGTTTTTTFKATADSYVRADQPDTNFNTGYILDTEGANPVMNTYVKFTVAGLTGTVTAATLQLYSYSTSAEGISVATTSSTWTESAITYNNAPAVGAVVGQGPNIVVNTTAAVTVTPAVTGNATYAFAVTTTRAAINKFASRESTANAPTLVVTTTSGGGSTSPTPTPSVPGSPTPSGSVGPTPSSAAPSVPASPVPSQTAGPTVDPTPSTVGTRITAVGGAVQSAMVGTMFAAPLAVKVVAPDGSTPAGAPVTFTAPSTDPDATFPGGAPTVTVVTDATGTATSPPVTAGTTAGTYAVTATANGASQAAVFTLTNTDPRIVAAGDIACPSGKTVTATSCQQQATSDHALSLHPDAVLPLGDDQYELGTLSDFQTVYDPTWGRLNPIAHPVPGNHEYGYIGSDIQPTGGTGYFTYFGDVSHPLQPGCTTLCTSWYSWNIGSWHMVALDSQCAVVNGCNPGNPQYQWLVSDLNANKNKCVLAYWHIPIYSSSQDHQPDMQAIYSLLYTKGADVVLTGHAHFYERFNGQDGAGNASPTGIPEFIVGSGGRSFFAIRPTPSANSAAQIANTFGVLQMTLSTDSYSWQFVPSNTGGQTDGGTGTCH